MASEKKLSRYLMYALGEILLVVVGILIALQINNWNSNRVKQKEVRSSYERVLEEIGSTKGQVSDNITFITREVNNRNLRSLKLMGSKNTDSIHSLFENLGALVQVINVQYDMPYTVEFLNNENISQVESSNLKYLLLQLQRHLKFGDAINLYATNQLNTMIEPYVMKRFNYAQIVNEDYMTAISHAVSPMEYVDDLELENLINLKLETDHGKIRYLEQLLVLLKATEEEIKTQMGAGDR